MAKHARVYGEFDRQAFLAALKAMRDACIGTLRKAPIGKVDYQTADTMKSRVDDAVEALTGDRQALWLKQHGGGRVPDTPLLPVKPEDQ